MITALLVPRRLRWNSDVKLLEYPVQAWRIPYVIHARTVQNVPGGYTEATFTIPTEHADGVADLFLREGVQAWLYDRGEPIFYGVLRKATSTPDGSVDVSLDGMWRLLGDTRMREVWADGDLSQLSPSPQNTAAAQIGLTAAGNMRIAIPEGTHVRAGEQATVDYYLFNEPIGTRDGKVIDGFDVSTSDGNYAASGLMDFQVYGRASPVATTGVHLYTNATAPPWNHHETSPGGGWNLPGYRCIRLGLFFNTDYPSTSQTRDVIIDRFRVSTTATDLGIDPIVIPTTTTIAKNLWRQVQSGSLLDLHPYLLEPAYANAASIGRQVTGNIETGLTRTVDGVAFTEWTSPMEILEALAAIDGYIVGMWLPAKRYPPNSMIVASGKESSQTWHWAPPELIYAPWPHLSEASYYVYATNGALWEPDEQAESTLTAVYVNYSTVKGNTRSEYVEDATHNNYLWLQGQHKADEWNIDPPVNRATALALGQQYLENRRQPAISGRLTVYGDRPGAIQGPLGQPIPRLSGLRPGVVRIPDARRARAGRVTQIEWSARTESEPEKVVLTVNAPASANLDRYLAKLARKAERTRTR